MYCPNTGTLILGFEYCGKDMYLSHAIEHGLSNDDTPFDAFVRGWIGVDKRKYKHGVIHFAPPVSTRSPKFDAAFATVEMFRRNGADGKTVLRGFGEVWERKIADIFQRTEGEAM